MLCKNRENLIIINESKLREEGREEGGRLLTTVHLTPFMSLVT